MQQGIIDDVTGGMLPTGITTDNALETGLSWVFFFAGFVSLTFIVIGGFRYVISSGDPQKVAAAKDTIIYAVIGLIIALSAFTIVRLVLGVAVPT